MNHFYKMLVFDDESECKDYFIYFHNYVGSHVVKKSFPPGFKKGSFIFFINNSGLVVYSSTCLIDKTLSDIDPKYINVLELNSFDPEVQYFKMIEKLALL